MGKYLLLSIDGSCHAIYRQQKVLSHFRVCCCIDWLLMIKNCLIQSGPPCIFIFCFMCTPFKNRRNYAIHFIRSATFMIVLQTAYPSSPQRGRPTETRLQLSYSNIPTGSNMWSQVLEWARHQDILTDRQSESNFDFRFRSFCLTQLYFNISLLFYSNYPLQVLVVRPSSGGYIYLHIYIYRKLT
jgi:hypothetical protein